MTHFRAAFFLLLLIAIPGAAELTNIPPFPGVSFESISTADPRIHYYVVTIDLTSPHVRLKVSRAGDFSKVQKPWEAALMPVSEMAQRDNLSVAINGNLFECRAAQMIMGVKFPYFAGNWARVSGWAMSDGTLFSSEPKDRNWPALVVDDQDHVTVGKFESAPPNARQMVAGVWQIITDGEITVGHETSGPRVEPMPHTAVGISRNGKTAIFFVVDGRRANSSIGMTWLQVASQLADRGAYNALLLDGGGSSTLVMRNNRQKTDVINQPSDGHDSILPLTIPRCVANALGVVIDGAATQPAQP